MKKTIIEIAEAINKMIEEYGNHVHILEYHAENDNGGVEETNVRHVAINKAVTSTTTYIAVARERFDDESLGLDNNCSSEIITYKLWLLPKDKQDERVFILSSTENKTSQNIHYSIKDNTITICEEYFNFDDSYYKKLTFSNIEE